VERPVRPPNHGRALEEDNYCWVCGGPASKRHCKIICPRCGFMRDCSDP